MHIFQILQYITAFVGKAVKVKPTGECSNAFRHTNAAFAILHSCIRKLKNNHQNHSQLELFLSFSNIYE